MGRHKEGSGKEKEALTVWIDKDLKADLFALAKKGDMSPSRLASNLLEMGIHTLAETDQYGIFRTPVVLRNMAEALKGWLVAVKEDPETFQRVVPAPSD